MAKTPITVRVEDDVLLDLKTWMDRQPAAPTLTSAVEAAIAALIEANPTTD